MKAVFTALFVSALSLGSAEAHLPKPSPLLRLETTNGSVPPLHRRVRTCEITATTVTQITRGPSVRAVPVVTQVAYTDKVRNEAELLRLIKAAKKGVLHEERRAPGGMGITTYEASETVAHPDFALLKRIGGRKIESRKNAAARTLVDFIDFNCNEQ